MWDKSPGKNLRPAFYPLYLSQLLTPCNPVTFLPKSPSFLPFQTNTTPEEAMLAALAGPSSSGTP